MRILLPALVLFAPCLQERSLFEDFSARVGIPPGPAPTVCFADLNNDGWPDVVANRTQIFLSDKGRKLVRHPASDTLQPKGPRDAQAVQLGDVNNDGNLDLFLCFMTDLSNKDFKDDGRRNELWLGDGKGGFKKAAKPGWGDEATLSATACFLDFDRDGTLDLYVGNWYARPWQTEEAQVSRLYRGRGDGTFEDVTEKAGMLGVAEAGKRESRKPVFGATSTDWNNDGWPDLLVCVYGRQWNQLWKNNGDGTFTEVGEQTTFDGDEDESGTYTDQVRELYRKKGQRIDDDPPYRANGNTFDCAVADFDCDGDMDCFLGEIAHWWAGPSSDRSMLLVNEGERGGYAFKRDATRLGDLRPVPDVNWNEGDLHVGWLDVDNDGWQDLLVASSDYPDEQIVKLYHQKPDHTFEDWTATLGFRWVSASQISLGDFDRDGATDILVGRNHMRLTPEQQKAYPLTFGLFRNTIAAKMGNSFFTLRLMGQAVGARVRLWTGNHCQTREVYGGLGHAGHRDDTDCRFGVGKAAVIDKIEVRWNDGKTVQTFEKVAPGRIYTLKKGGTLKE
jgi:hypothetical protein